MKLYEIHQPQEESIRTFMELVDVDYTINPDGSVDVDGNVDLKSVRLVWKEGSPIKWGHIKGDFRATMMNEQFTSLVNFPHTVDGDFSIEHSSIKSLVGGPKIVGGNYYATDTQITDLNGVAEKIGGVFNARKTQIASLSGIHKTHKNWVVERYINIPTAVTHILGLALIPGITKLLRMNSLADRQEYDLSSHDVHAFQEQLLDAGLKAQARL